MLTSCTWLSFNPELVILINSQLDCIFFHIEKGDYVVCAVCGKNITLDQLTYWNVELQEAYFSPKEAQQRYEELNKK